MQLKVVCLNIWIGGLLFEPMVDFLEKEAADIYLLQEVYAGEDPALGTNIFPELTTNSRILV